MTLSRRTILRSGALAIAAPALAKLSPLTTPAAARRPRLLAARPVAVRRGRSTRPTSSISTTSIRRRPKGGMARMIAIGTFDNFNMAVAGVRGSLAAG